MNPKIRKHPSRAAGGLTYRERRNERADASQSGPRHPSGRRHGLWTMAFEFFSPGLMTILAEAGGRAVLARSWVLAYRGGGGCRGRLGAGSLRRRSRHRGLRYFQWRSVWSLTSAPRVRSFGPERSRPAETRGLSPAEQVQFFPASKPATGTALDIWLPSIRNTRPRDDDRRTFNAS
jgi:hypothetical protein